MVHPTRNIRSPSRLAIAFLWPVAALAAALAVPGRGIATEVVSVSNEFAIYRDFSKIVLQGEVARNARVFVDPIRMVSTTENAELHAIVLRGLSARLQVVQDKKDANYLIQIVMQKNTNYAIRDPRRRPALGYILLSTCKYPIQEVVIATTCENLTYFYFEKYPYNAVFQKVFSMWIEAVVPNGSKN